MRTRLAPSAMRTATSRRRVSPRASSRPATLMHAISSTPATAASRTSSAVRTPWIIRSRAGVTAIVTLVLVSGYAFSSRAAIPAISVAAWSSATPSFRRATGRMPGCQPRSAGCAAMNGAIGRKTSAFWNRRNDGGSTPTIEYGLPSSRMRSLVTASRPPKRDCQRPWLRIATGDRPAFLVGREPRPTIGVTPSRGSMLAVSIFAGMRSGSLPPLMFAVKLRNAPQACSAVASRHTSRKFSADSDSNGNEGVRSLMTTTRPASWKGSGRSMTASTTVKMAELAPTPSAMVSTAIAVKPGCFLSARKARRKLSEHVSPV